MDPEYDDLVLIEAFLRGELEKEEAIQFELRVKTDADFKRQVEEIRLIRDAAKNSAKERLKNEITSAESRFLNSRTRKGIALPTYVRIAAAIAILAVIGFFLFPRDGAGMEIFKEEFSHLTNYSVYKGEGSEAAMWAYEYKNYEEAIPLLERVRPDSPQFDSVQVYLGVCHLAIGEYTKGIEVLERYTQESRGQFLEHTALWYLSLGFLAEENLEPAKNTLTVLASDALLPRHQDALKILSKLK